MALTDLVPWKWGEKQVSVRREEDPFLARREEMDRIFDDFFRSSELGYFGGAGFSPRVNVAEKEDKVLVSAELPGLEEKDIEVSLSRDTLTISGEKRYEKEEEDQNFYRRERSHGSFSRSVPISCPIDHDKVEATYKNGVLTVSLPKIHHGRECTRVKIK